MGQFLVRVELHGATKAIYSNLHTLMDAAGFKMEIEIDGKRYKLPEAEYVFSEKKAKISGVVRKASEIAAEAWAAGREAFVLVTKVDEIEQDGLEQVPLEEMTKAKKKK